MNLQTRFIFAKVVLLQVVTLSPSKQEKAPDLPFTAYLAICTSVQWHKMENKRQHLIKSNDNMELCQKRNMDSPNQNPEAETTEYTTDYNSPLSTNR